MKRSLSTLTVLLLSVLLHAQHADTMNTNIPGTWKKFHPGIRVAVGIQKSFYTEAGIAWQRYIYDARHGFEATAYYASFQWTPPTKGNEKVYGVKAGAELAHNGGAGGIECTYLWNSVSNDFVITPKIGFGLGFVNLFYGYNLSTNKYPFPNIRKSQFSLAINTNLLFFQSKYDKK
jgi:hypothetical protein